MKLIKNIFLLSSVLIVVHILILSFFRFTAWPEMLSFPFVTGNGFLLYKDFHHVYQPLLTIILLGVYKIFGFTPVVLKIFTWLWIVLTDISIIAVSNKLSRNKYIAIIPLALYVILQPLFEGNMMWFDFASGLPLLISAYMMISFAKDKNNFSAVYSGIFLSLAFLIKQQAILLLVPLVIYLVAKKTPFKVCLKFLLGASIPIAITLAVLILKGILSDYIFWTFRLPLEWFSKMPGYKIPPIRKEYLILLLMILTPITAFIPDILKKKIIWEKVLIFLMFFFSLIFAFPRFSFFHLQPGLCFFVISLAFVFENRKLLFSFFAVLVIAYLIFARWGVMKYETGGVRFYGDEEINLARYIDTKTKPSDKIYLLGPNSSIYVFADRVPPKPWIENYVWHFDVPGMQEKVISGWEKDPPKIIFRTPPVPGNWYTPGTYQPAKIISWISENYLLKEKTKYGVEVWCKMGE